MIPIIMAPIIPREARMAMIRVPRSVKITGSTPHVSQLYQCPGGVNHHTPPLQTQKGNQDTDADRDGMLQRCQVLPG